MKSKTARKRKRNARRAKIEKQLRRRRAIAKSRMVPIAMASKNGLAVPLRRDGLIRDLVSCTSRGLIVSMHVRGGEEPDPWKSLNHMELLIIEETDWVPDMPPHPLEKLAEAAV